MRCVDQAMTAVSSGEVADTVAVSDICCRLLGACELTFDLRRAEQWMPVIERLAWQSFVPPVCRTHYGGILTAVGRWDQAEKELTSALDALEHSYRLMREGPLLRLADLRLRQGRFEEAGRLLEGSESHPSARRTRAAIAYAEGEFELAAELTSLCLGDESEDNPGCAPVLGLLVDAGLARSDTPAAAEALALFLERLAERTDAESCVAYAAYARGRVGGRGPRLRSRPGARAAGSVACLRRPWAAARSRSRAQHDLARALSSTARQAAIAEAQVGSERVRANRRGPRC